MNSGVGMGVSILNLGVGIEVSVITGSKVGAGVGVIAKPGVIVDTGVEVPCACLVTYWGTPGIKPSLVAGSPSKS